MKYQHKLSFCHQILNFNIRCAPYPSKDLVILYSPGDEVYISGFCEKKFLIVTSLRGHRALSQRIQPSLRL